MQNSNSLEPQQDTTPSHMYWCILTINLFTCALFGTQTAQTLQWSHLHEKHNTLSLNTSYEKFISVCTLCFLTENNHIKMPPLKYLLWMVNSKATVAFWLENLIRSKPLYTHKHASTNNHLHANTLSISVPSRSLWCCLWWRRMNEKAARWLHITLSSKPRLCTWLPLYPRTTSNYMQSFRRVWRNGGVCRCVCTSQTLMCTLFRL